MSLRGGQSYGRPYLRLRWAYFTGGNKFQVAKDSTSGGFFRGDQVKSIQYLRYQTGKATMTRPEKMLDSLREQTLKHPMADISIDGRYIQEMDILMCEQNRLYLDSAIPNAWYLDSPHHGPNSNHASVTCKSSPSVCVTSQNGAFHLGPPSRLALLNFLACTSRLSTISALGGDLTQPPSAGSVALRLTFCLLISAVTLF